MKKKKTKEEEQKMDKQKQHTIHKERNADSHNPGTNPHTTHADPATNRTYKRYTRNNDPATNPLQQGH